MQLINATKLAAGYTMATDKTGREWLVVVAKGTYGIPSSPDREPPLLEEQVPLVMTDVFSGEPGFSAPLYENDFALHKPRCDVLLNGSCHAPGGRAAATVPVGLRVGSITKSFNVVGNRTWRPGVLTTTSGLPEPFTVMPLSYDNAYGGVDMPDEDLKTHQWYSANHVGVGHHPKSSGKALVGRPLPNTEEIGDAVSTPSGNYKPMAFGPIARSWPQRIKWAGTYDQKWKDATFPFLPQDFDERYFQSAPIDQQLDHISGGEQVVLLNLTPRGRDVFMLPAMDIPILFLSRSGQKNLTKTAVDTVVIEPDLNRFTLASRVAFPLRRSIREVREVHVGRSFVPGEPISEKPGKRRFASLADLSAATGRQSDE
jgi:hypothetical protein